MIQRHMNGAARKILIHLIRSRLCQETQTRTQETILVKKRVVCCERWPTKFGLRKNPKCRSRRAVPALPPCATGGREAGRAIETVAFSTKVNGAAADGGKWERGGERRERRGKEEARPNRTTCTHAHATTNGEGRGGRGLAQPAS